MSLTHAFFSRFEEDCRQAGLTQPMTSEYDQPPHPNTSGTTSPVWPLHQYITRTGRVLKSCAHQFDAVFSHVFNCPLQSLKTAPIIPVPKFSAITGLSDNRPVNLTLVAMKRMERLVLQHIKVHVPPSCDQSQFTYRSNRATDDALYHGLHRSPPQKAPKHTSGCFVDCSITFNTSSPTNCRYCYFLTNGPQHVRMGTSTVHPPPSS